MSSSSSSEDTTDGVPGSAGGGEGDGEVITEDQPKVEEEETLTRAFGTCKWFDVSRGYGFVTTQQQQTVTTGNVNNNNDVVQQADPSVQDCQSTSSEFACDIFVYQSAIQMPGFRCLSEGEPVVVWYRSSARGLEATRVCGPDGHQDCEGRSGREKRTRTRRRKRPDRCYNCSELGHHARQCQLDRMPKRCHKCKSHDHLYGECPDRGAKQQAAAGDDDQEDNDEGDQTDQEQMINNNAQFG